MDHMAQQEGKRMSKRRLVSAHQLRVFDFVRGRRGWVTGREIAQGADVALRTARQHAFSFVKLGVFDEARVFPEYRYRISSTAPQTAAWLEAARDPLGTGAANND
jgi:hypothetical protein